MVFKKNCFNLIDNFKNNDIIEAHAQVSQRYAKLSVKIK